MNTPSFGPVEFTQHNAMLVVTPSLEVIMRARRQAMRPPIDAADHAIGEVPVVKALAARQ